MYILLYLAIISNENLFSHHYFRYYHNNMIIICVLIPYHICYVYIGCTGGLIILLRLCSHNIATRHILLLMV